MTICQHCGNEFDPQETRYVAARFELGSDSKFEYQRADFHLYCFSEFVREHRRAFSTQIPEEDLWAVIKLGPHILRDITSTLAP